MNNNGRAITNASFRRKILDVIDKLKNQSKTAMNPRVDDFEQLNVDVFESSMAALVQAIGSGGDGGDFTIVTASFNNDGYMETDLTAGELTELASDDKGFVLKLALPESDISMYLYAVEIGEIQGEGYALVTFGIDDKFRVVRVPFSASTANDKFVQAMDVPEILLDANGITYDNSSSGLSATKVQDAIDELAESGGGGSSNVEVLEYELETSTSKIVTKKTFNEIVALYDAGKAIVMPVHVAIETEGTTMHYRLIVNFGMISNYIEEGQEYWVLYGYSKGPNASTFPVTFFAESAASVMKASIGE